MVILILSDTHLCYVFEEKKYRFLRHIIQKADKVIINGDFWDGYITSFDGFIHSQWRLLFPILKSRQAIYLYGNHDNPRFSDYRTTLFSSVAATTHKLMFANKTFVIEHGNRLLRYFDEKLGFNKPHPFWAWNARQLGRFLVRKYKDRFIDFYYRPDNQKIKDKISTEFQHGEIIICGHTHAAEIDIKHRFINTGLINYGLGQYIMLKDGKVQFHQEWYE